MNSLTNVTADQFEQALQACQEVQPIGFSGPYIHSIPAGNMFSNPIRKTAYCYYSQTILLKTEDLKTGKTEYRAVRKSAESPEVAR